MAAMNRMRRFLRWTMGVLQPLPSEKPEAPAKAMAGMSTSIPVSMPDFTAATAAKLPDNSAATVESQKQATVISATAPAVAWIFAFIAISRFE